MRTVLLAASASLVAVLLIQSCDNSTEPYVPNHAPLFVQIPIQVVEEGFRLQFVVEAFDSDGTVPVLSVKGAPANSVAVDSGNGKMLFVFEPDLSQSGVYFVIFEASDGCAISELVVTIEVDPNRLADTWPMAVGNYWVYETSHYETLLSDTRWYDLWDSTNVTIDSICVVSGSQENGSGQWLLSNGSHVIVRGDSINDIAMPPVWSDRVETVPAGCFNQTYEYCTLHGLLPSCPSCLIFARGVGIIKRYSCTVWNVDASCTVSRLLRYRVK